MQREQIYEGRVPVQVTIPEYYCIRNSTSKSRDQGMIVNKWCLVVLTALSLSLLYNTMGPVWNPATHIYTTVIIQQFGHFS